MTFNKWLDTFIDEKEIDLETILEVRGKSGNLNIIPLEVLIDNIKIASKNDQDAIKNTLVKIDFLNGDVMGFFKWIAPAIAI